ISYMTYIWTWVWRGEAPSGPFIFIRPIMNIFMKRHFERHLRRLRNEILLSDEISDTTRASLFSRIDSALERYKSPRFTAMFLAPGILTLPTYYISFIKILEYFKIDIQSDEIRHLMSEIDWDNVEIVSLVAIAYLLSVPFTGFLAKRGLF